MTAVEWLENELKLYYSGESKLVYYEIFGQAKEMEKQQIIDAYQDGWNAGDFGSDCWEEIYYNDKLKD